MNVAEQQSAVSFLRRCTAAYEALVAHVLQLEVGGDDEKTLKWISLAAGIAWTAHPGRYSDGRLEAAALRIGERLSGQIPSSAGRTIEAGSEANKTRRVLHVATSVYETGGHTRLIENWIKSDVGARHSLVLLDQQQDPVRAELRLEIAESRGEMILLPANSSLLDQARQLRSVAQSGYDFIILHHHPNDVVPLVALATADCPPVAVMNHADHVYWLGVSVADLVIEFRHFGARLSRERRGARQTLMFPLPIDIGSRAIDREGAREQLGIGNTEVMLLSIGSAYKYKSTKTHDFFRTVDQILTANPAARLYVIGVNSDDLRAFGILKHPRLELLGVISDPSLYQVAADLYLESFPYGSYTALIETSAHGVCPVLMYSPLSYTDVSDDVPLQGLIASPTDEADYIRRVSDLINDSDARTRLGQAVARQIASFHGVDARPAYLKPILELLAATAHRPEPVPAFASAETEDDLALALPSSARIKSAVLAQIWPEAVAGMSLGDLLRIFSISLRAGDTRLFSSDMKSWLGLFLRRFFEKPPAARRGK